MKKTIVFALTLIMAFSLTACGTQSEVVSSEPVTSTAPSSSSSSSSLKDTPPASSKATESSTESKVASSSTVSSMPESTSSSSSVTSVPNTSSATSTPSSSAAESQKEAPTATEPPVSAASESKSNITAAPPTGTGVTDLYFTLNGQTLNTESLEKISNGGGKHDSAGDGIKENIGFSMLIELMGKKPEQLADTGKIEFMDGTTVTKSVGDLVQSVVVFKSNDESINDKWGDYNLRFRFICNDVPLRYVKSVTWAVK